MLKLKKIFMMIRIETVSMLEWICKEGIQMASKASIRITEEGKAKKIMTQIILMMKKIYLILNFLIMVKKFTKSQMSQVWSSQVLKEQAQSNRMMRRMLLSDNLAIRKKWFLQKIE